MRPITMRLNGLRSYVTEQVIDFTDADLMAIVGDTGAGKSSLLEALCVALYGCCTWDARGAKALIADGANTLQVELTFRVGEKIWKVTRAISRGVYPPAVHLLECLDDGARFDNSDSVNAAIRRLIGLDFPTFLKAVVLPQGRFQILLQMSNTDRTPILRSILGLDQLTAVRETAFELANRLRPVLTILQQRRAAMLTDPDAAARDARRRLREAKASVTTLSGVQKKIAEARVVEGQARARADAKTSVAQRIVEATTADVDDQYEQLVGAESGLAASRTHAEAKVGSVETEERALQERLDEADRSGVGIAHLAAARTTVTGIIAELPDIAAEHECCIAEREAIAADRTALKSRSDDLTVLETEAQKADQAVIESEGAVAIATSNLDSAQSGVKSARSATHGAADAAEKATALTTALEQCITAAADAAAAAQAAEEAHAASVAHLDAVWRSAAAAHAASASHAGDPCPICNRLLPDGFVAPDAPGEKDAAAASAAAEKEAKSSAGRAVASATTAEATRAALATAMTDAEEHERRRVDAMESLTHLIGPTDLSKPDDVLLAEATKLLDTAADALADAKAYAQTTRDGFTRATSELRANEEAVARRDAALASALTALERREQKMRQSVASLPPAFRLPEPYGEEAAREQLARIAERQKKLVGVANQLVDARGETAHAREAVKEVESRWKKEIDEPLQQVRRGMERLTERVADACKLLGEPLPTGLPEGTLDAEAQWAREVVTEAGRVVERVRDRAHAEAETADRAAKEVSIAFESAAVEDDAGLKERLVTASVEAVIAEGDLRTAGGQVPIAADLDSRIGAGAPFIDALDELVRLLADGKFLGAVVRRKQRALLGVASELLGDITGQRFGFAEAFQIVDRLSGQPRDVKTLSGGETFLASLALALALVELAGRGGGRLEALFLDEGFGSLDANSLAEALDALSRQAEGGRLVAVISHLHAVAENIEHVLLVTKGSRGSEVRWAKDVEREELIGDELRSGLLA